MSATPSMGTMLNRIGETQMPLPVPAVVLIGLAALAAVGVQAFWEAVRYVDTIPHEGAHAIAGSALGRKVLSVALSRDGGGETNVSPGGAGGNVLIGFVGYLGPSTFGLGAARLIEIGHSVAVLWLSLLLLIILLVVLRGIFSFVPVLVVGGIIYLIARYAALGTQIATAYAVAWFLLLAGVRKVIYRGINAADAGILRDLTRIGRGFWVLLWLAGSVTAVAVGGALLV